MPTVNSFGTRAALPIAGRTVQIYSLPALAAAGFPEIARLPYSLKILLENLLRNEDGRFVKAADIEALAKWDVKSTARARSRSCPRASCCRTSPGSLASWILPPCATASRAWAATPTRSTLQPVELVIDHSVQVDYFGMADAFQKNADLEFAQSGALRVSQVGQSAFNNFRVVPPDTGIVHQVNLEYLARVVA
jgi:aconitate hydratase